MSADGNPTLWESRRLWSLWDMLRINAAPYNSFIHALFDLELRVRGMAGSPSSEVRKTFRNAVDEAEKRCLELSLSTSLEVIRHMLKDADRYEDIHRGLTQLAHTFMLELKSREFLGIEQKHLVYFERPELFGRMVFDNFPSANDDIFEAGCCLALDRPTACVMHLMRVLEAGLTVLAADLGIPKQNDWGGFLRTIGKALEERAKGSKARSEDEQFYAEAATSFDWIRRAWRNPTMHVDKSYSLDKAEEILRSVKSFMVHLAGRLKEQDA